MALLIQCPGCGMQIVNNGENCPFCGYNVKEDKSKEEMELEAEEALQEAEASEETVEEPAAVDAAEETVSEEVSQNAAAPQVSGNIVGSELPDIPNNSDPSKLPPMQPKREVTIEQIQHTPAVKLSPIEKEKVDKTLPPMQPEREVTIEQIQHTPAVKLSPIEKEKIENKLPDIGSPEAAPPGSQAAGCQVAVETPTPRRPKITVEKVNVPPRPATPAPQQPAVPQQRVAPQPQQPTVPQQRVAPAPQPQQRVAPAPQPQQPAVPQQPVAPAPQPTAAQPPKKKKQWSSDPQDFAQDQTRTPEPKQQSENKPKQKRQWSTQQKGSENSDDDGFDIETFKRQIEEDKIRASQQQNVVNEILSSSASDGSPMKFDGKEVRAAKVNVVSAPSKKNLIIPIAIVAILVIALIAVVIFMLSGGTGSEESSAGSADTSASSSSKKGAEQSVKFQKPDDWGDTIYAYVYNEGGAKNAEWPGEKMKKESDGTYSYKVSGEIENPLIIFNDGKAEKDGEEKNQYPDANEPGEAVKDGKTYEVPVTYGKITFVKPDDWGDTVYAFVCSQGSGEIKNAEWPGKEMIDNGDGTYSYNVPNAIKDPIVTFTDGTEKNKYPKSTGTPVEKGKTYEVE